MPCLSWPPTERAKQNAGYPLFADFINDWLKVKKQTVKETTYKSYVNLLSRNILPKFGQYHVNEITRKDIQDFLFELTDEGKNRTAQNFFQHRRYGNLPYYFSIALSRLFRLAVNKRLVVSYRFQLAHTHTRTKECGCNPELVMKWVGHEFDADVKTSRVDRGYTTYSQEYILQEINKIDYEL